MKDQFVHALKQLEKAAKVINLDLETLDRLKSIDRILKVSIPVKMDDGNIKVFEGYRSQHNNARGPYKGGIRFNLDVSEEEVKALSMWMSWKCAVAQIPYGGGKGGVIVDSGKLSKGELERLSRGYIRAIYKIIGPDIDIPAPDMYTTSEIMGWMVDEYSRLVGCWSPAVITAKPIELGGSLGRTEATGLGGFYHLMNLIRYKNLDPKNTTIAVQGFGNVGYYFAYFAQKEGLKIVAVSDSKGGIYDKDGLDIELLFKYKQDSAKLEGFSKSLKITNEELLELDVDILIPAALENVITEKNANSIKAKYIIEMANGPVTPEADEIFIQKKILSVPDVLANSGGVTVSYFEWVQNRQGLYWSKKVVFEELKKLMDIAFDKTIEAMEKYKVDMRMGAYANAVQSVVESMKAKGL